MDARRQFVEDVFRAAVQAVDPEQAVYRHLSRVGATLRIGTRSYDLARYRRVLLMGAGKGTAPMARALETILGDRIDVGLIVVKYGHGLPLKHTRVFEAAHPVPDRTGIEATRLMFEQVQSCASDDLILFAFSGGGSALMPAPRKPLEMADKQLTTRLLLECGATIDEINAIRKHLSFVKGGGLARAAHPATVVSLILSDVVGDPLDVIASGPTAPRSRDGCCRK